MNKPELINKYRAFVDQDGLFLKTLDQISNADQYFELEVSDFLTPDLIQVFENIVQFNTELKCIKWGVFKEAEREKLCFYPEYIDPGNMEDYITLLEVSYNSKFNQLEHKDALGSLMSLGIQRKKIGDIVVFDGGFQIAVDHSLSDYFVNTVERIGKASVSVKKISFDKAIVKQIVYKTVQGTVKSMRLDSIIAMCFSISRTDAQKAIHSEHVKVNHMITNNLSYEPKCEDLISVRQMGRFKVLEILGTTKKDRIRLVLALYSS